MRRGLVGLALLLCTLTPAFAQLSINFGSPGVNIGINVGAYPTLQRVPGYPVYYAPGMNSNYFFYDGLYWVFQADSWYASSWYNGPWNLVDAMDVPAYLWRVPVRYYRHAPSYFRSWRADDAPRWDEHWGASWQKRHSGWNQWDRNSAPTPAPLPTYQRQYSGSRYPQGSQQAVIESQNYRYQPTDAVAQQQFQQRRAQAQAAPQQQQPAPQRQQPLQTRSTQQRPSPETGQQQARQPQQQPAPQQQPLQTRSTQQRPSPETGQQQARQPQQQPVRTQQAQPQPQPAKQQAPAQREAQAAREQAPRPQAQERAPQGKPPENKEQGRGDNKDNKEKGPER